MADLIRPLRAVANGGSADINLLAARAADEIERLRKALLNIQDEVMREGGRWPHLKRVVAIQLAAAISSQKRGNPNE